jgi:hypothetical protein
VISVGRLRAFSPDPQVVVRVRRVRRLLGWLLVLLVVLFATEVRLSHGEHRFVGKVPLTWHRDR